MALVNGSNSDDSLRGTSGNDMINGLGGDDVLSGLGGDDEEHGGDGSDYVRGNGGNDRLFGDAGDDYLRGDGGDDYLDGGAGIDRAGYFTSPVGVHVSLLLQGAPQDTGQGWDTLVSIENLSGTTMSDTLIGDDGDNWLWGSGPGLPGAPLTSDTLIGNGGNDLLGAGAGNHVIDGGAGNDTLSFAIPEDTFGGLAVSLLEQGHAQDTGQGMMTLTSIENLSGGAHDDTLTGDAGDNILAGSAGSDHVAGGAGNDTLLGDGMIWNLPSGASDSGSSHVYLSGEGEGQDVYDAQGNMVYVWTGQDLYDASGNRFDRTDYPDDGDSVFTLGDRSLDVFYGDPTGSDGVHGNDVLDGGAGNDLLIGGAGADVLTGGPGADVFKYLDVSDSRPGGADVIKDFQMGVDTIDLSAIDANTRVAGDQAFHFVRAFTGAGGEGVVQYDRAADVTHLLFDTNGDKAADMQIDLAGNFSAFGALAEGFEHLPAALHLPIHAPVIA